MPDGSLIVLIGASGSGKTTFANRYFQPSQIVSSDHFRTVLTDHQQDFRVDEEVFSILHRIVEVRLGLDRLTVVDSTAVEAFARRRLLEIAGRTGAFKVAIVFDIPEKVCIERDRHRCWSVGPEVIHRQKQQLLEARESFEEEGWDSVLSLTLTTSPVFEMARIA